MKNNPVFLITEDDVKQASFLLESSSSSKKDKRDERRKKASGNESLFQIKSFFKAFVKSELEVFL